MKVIQLDPIDDCAQRSLMKRTVRRGVDVDAIGATVALFEMASIIQNGIALLETWMSNVSPTTLAMQPRCPAFHRNFVSQHCLCVSNTITPANGALRKQYT
jgi:hypothetical protein